MGRRLPIVLVFSILLVTQESRAEDGDVPHAWQQLDTEHFVFHYHKKSINRVEPLALAVEDELDRVLEVVGLADIDPVEVRVARNVHEMASVKPGQPPPPWATGLAMRDSRIILLSLTSSDDATPTPAMDVLVHEIVHMVEWDATAGHPTPLWFSEGLAIHLSGESTWVRRKVLADAALRGRLLPISMLSSRYPGDGHQVNVAYAQSADLVGFLEKEYGPGLLAHVMQQVGEGAEFESTLESRAGLSMAQIESRWRDSLDVWYRWVPSLTGGATLWVVIAVILMAVYFRRRQQARSVHTRWEREEAEQRAKLEEWMWQHWDPSSIPRPSDDRSSIDHDGNTYTLH